MVTPNRTYSPIGSVVFTLFVFVLLFSSRSVRGATTAPEPERQAEEPPILRIPRAGGGGRGINNIPPVCISFPGDDSQRQRDEAAYMRDRLTDMLDSIGFGRMGGPLFEENCEEGQEEEGAPEQPYLSNYKDPYVAERNGPFVITTWGDLWRVEAQGGQCNA